MIDIRLTDAEFHELMDALTEIMRQLKEKK